MASSLVDRATQWLGTTIGGTVATLLGTVVVAMAGVLACVALLVGAGWARRGAIGFAAAASGLVAAAAVLAWAVVDRVLEPSWLASTTVGNGVGAAVVLLPLVLTLMSHHAGARHRLASALAACAGVAAYTAAAPLISTLDLAHLPLHWSASYLLRVLFDIALVTASIALVIVVANPEAVTVGATPLPPRRPLAEAAMAVCALLVVVVTISGTLAIEEEPTWAGVASGEIAAATFDTYDDRLGRFVGATTDFHRKLAYELPRVGDNPCAGAGTAECAVLVELRESLAECEKAWPPNLDPEIDASVSDVLAVLRAALAEYESALQRPGPDQGRGLVDLDIRFRAALAALGATVNGTGRASTCSGEVLSADLSGALGGAVAPATGSGSSSCRGGWAIVAVKRSPPCASTCDGRAIARMVRGRWEVATELPGTTCRDRLAGEGAPDFVRDELPRCDGVDPGVPDGSYQVTERPDHSLELSFASDVLFDFGSADLTPAARQTLDKTIERLASASGTIRIEGHTDSISSPAYNQQLSERRAGAVRDYLAGAGVAVPMEAVGFGLERPVAPNTNPDGSDNPEGRARNRRVTITYQPA